MIDLSRDQWEALSECVSRGSDLLDEVSPGWYRKIDTSTLNIGDGEICICGQLFVDKVGQQIRKDSSRIATDGFHWAVWNVIPDDKSSTEYGFIAPLLIGDTDMEYEALAILWIEKIEKRLAND